MSQYYIGQKFYGIYPPEAAVWCNLNNAHIELVEDNFTIVENAPAPEPTTEEKVQAIETETGMTRAVRELVLAENSGASDYVKAKAQEIEDLAKQLRTTEETTETVDNTKNNE